MRRKKGKITVNLLVKRSNLITVMLSEKKDEKLKKKRKKIEKKIK